MAGVEIHDVRGWRFSNEALAIGLVGLGSVQPRDCCWSARNGIDSFNSREAEHVIKRTVLQHEYKDMLYGG